MSHRDLRNVSQRPQNCLRDISKLSQKGLRDVSDVLNGLFDGAVGCEGLQLLLDAGEGVGELLVADDADGLLDPLQ